MNLQMFSFEPDTGWSVDTFPNMDSDRTLVVVCGASEYKNTPQPLKDLYDAYPKSRMIGCSTSGEIVNTAIQDRSLVVAVARFEKTPVDWTVAAVTCAAESFQAGESIAKDLLTDTLRGVIVFSDGLTVNGSDLVRGLNSVLPTNVIVTGGLAGDGDRFQETWVLNEGTPRSGFVSAVGLYGDRVKIGHGSKGGWDMFGPERKVTKADGNVLFELDGNPALELYKTYLGERATGLPATALLFPLALRTDDNDDKRIVRTILGVDEGAQSMTFAGDIPEGHLAQLMRANFDRLVHGASEAALMTKPEPSKDTETLSIAISCVGRRIVLGERAEEELEATMDVLPRNTKQLGFYSYGEISPYATGHCDLHNQTMTLTTISEE